MEIQRDGEREKQSDRETEDRKTEQQREKDRETEIQTEGRDGDTKRKQNIKNNYKG